MTYANVAKAPYPPPAAPAVDNLMAIDKVTKEDMHCLPSLLNFIDSRQRGALGMLLKAVFHPADDFLQFYIEESIPANTGPPWSREDLEKNGPRASECTPEIVGFMGG